MRVRSAALIALCTAAPVLASAASWRAVPGAELDVDLATVRQEGVRVVAWLRSWDRTVREVQFDCSRRTAQVLATTRYDARGRALLMSSIPGPRTTVVDGDLGWAYDSLCEMLRASGRF